MGILKIWNLEIYYSSYEGLCKGKKTKNTKFEKWIKKLEISLDHATNLGKYNSIKNELDAIYNHIAEGIHIRSKCDWYEHGEKLSIFFLILKNIKVCKI